MTYSDETVKFVLSRHWQHIDCNEIVKQARNVLKKKLAPREVRYICENYTLRHHGEPITRKKMGLEPCTVGC